MMNHEQVSELLAVYALDAVEADEVAQIEEHLSQCPRCRAELDAYREVVAALGNSVAPLPGGVWSIISSRLFDGHDEEPPALPFLLRERLSGEGARTSRSRGGPPPHSWRSSRGRRTIVAALVAAAAAAVAVLSINLTDANNQVAHLQGAIGETAHTAVVAALDTPGHKLVNLESSNHVELAQFVVVPDGRGYLVKSNLPTISSKDTYQLWGVIGGQTISLGLMGRSPNLVTFTLAGSPHPSLLSITVEPAGGSVVPSPMVASGTV
jgi:anti-sigma-K factor RskA